MSHMKQETRFLLFVIKGWFIYSCLYTMYVDESMLHKYINIAKTLQIHIYLYICNSVQSIVSTITQTQQIIHYAHT